MNLSFNYLNFFTENAFIVDMIDSFNKTFIVDNRWLSLLRGLGVTLEITFFALLLGIVLGFIVATVRASYDTTIGNKKCKNFGQRILKFFNSICNVYLTVIRGTPIVIQLMIIYYIIFGSSRNGILAAIISFGVNSGAYVAEIVRSGIMSIDRGQMEAGRSLGLNYTQTMIEIIFPQAFKNILPALGNEFIVLIKETSVAGYVALQDITYAGNLIRSRTYEAFFPLITVALVYLAIVMILSYFLKKLERRLRTSER